MPKPENRKRWYNTQNKAKTCHQSKKDFSILKKCKDLSAVRKRWYNTQTELKPVSSQKKMYNTQTGPKPVKSQKKMVQFSNRTNMSPVRKRWYNTQRGPKPVNSQKKMVQYSNRAKHCHLSEKDGTILKQCQNLLTVRKRL